jgi:hypothetical protein
VVSRRMPMGEATILDFRGAEEPTVCHRACRLQTPSGSDNGIREARFAEEETSEGAHELRRSRDQFGTKFADAATAEPRNGSTMRV